MGAPSQTVTYSTIAALALDKLSDKIADAIPVVMAPNMSLGVNLLLLRLLGDRVNLGRVRLPGHTAAPHTKGASGAGPPALSPATPS